MFFLLKLHRNKASSLSHTLKLRAYKIYKISCASHSFILFHLCFCLFIAKGTSCLRLIFHYKESFRQVETFHTKLLHLSIEKKF